MLAIARREHDAPALIERPQPNPVFGIERMLMNRYESLLLLLHLRARILARRRVRTKPGALLGHDGSVARKEHEHELIELRETHGVRRVPRRRHLVVDRGEEAVRGEVPRELRMVAEILRLCKKRTGVCFAVI